MTTAEYKTLCDTSRPLTLDLLKQYHTQHIFAIYSETFHATAEYCRSNPELEEIDLREFYDTVILSEMKFGYFDKNMDYKYCPMTYDKVKTAYGPGVYVYADARTYTYNYETQTYQYDNGLGYQIDQDGQLCNNAINGPLRIPDHSTLEKLWKLVDDTMFEEPCDP